MKGLHEWREAQFAVHKTEPNSGLGKAISYLLNHWPKLTLFLEQAGFHPRLVFINSIRISFQVRSLGVAQAHLPVPRPAAVYPLKR
jgi:hypothetical protein